MLRRVSISGLMVVTAVVAVVLGIALILIRERPVSMPVAEMLVCGFLPMASLLGCAAVPLVRRRGTGPRPALAGFVTFGAGAALIYLAIVASTSEPVHKVIRDALQAWESASPLNFAAATSAVLLPQLAVAAFGAWFTSRYRVRVTLERREGPGVATPRALTSAEV